MSTATPSSALSDVFHLDEVDVAKLDASVATPSGAVQKCTLKSLPNGNVGMSKFGLQSVYDQTNWK